MTADTISIVVPEGAEHGDVLTFVAAGGQEMEIPVPFGSKPGDELQIQVASNDSSQASATAEATNENKDDTVSQFDLGDGKVLELMSRLPEEMRDGGEASVDDDDDNTNDGTFSLPWQSGLELTRRWNEIPLDSKPKRILELGSGSLGLVGMSFAAKLQSKLAENAVVVLTDVLTAIPLLQHNLERNQAIFPSASIQARSLRWTIDNDEATSTGTTEAPHDCLFGSDLLYNEKYIPHLVATTKRLLHPTKGVFILAVRWRKPDIERDFFRDTGLEWELVKSSSSPGCCQLDWKDFGDPSNEDSNLYFHQTQISVEGKPKSLADITEEDTGKLSSDEFEAWERAHIQIFIGKPKKL
jgi:predicted nicotinamide N-methyase